MAAWQDGQDAPGRDAALGGLRREQRRRVLHRYADQVCTFNDDMQGTAAVVLAAALSATRAAGGRMRDQRIVIHGAGTAGLGIADMIRDVMVSEGLTRDEATRRFYALGSRGLLVDDAPALRDFQTAYGASRCVARVLGELAADGLGARLPSCSLRIAGCPRRTVNGASSRSHRYEVYAANVAASAGIA